VLEVGNWLVGLSRMGSRLKIIQRVHQYGPGERPEHGGRTIPYTRDQ